MLFIRGQCDELSNISDVFFYALKESGTSYIYFMF